MGDTLGVGAMAGLVSDMGASCTVNKQQFQSVVRLAGTGKITEEAVALMFVAMLRTKPKDGEWNFGPVFECLREANPSLDWGKVIGLMDQPEWVLADFAAFSRMAQSFRLIVGGPFPLPPLIVTLWKNAPAQLSILKAATLDPLFSFAHAARKIEPVEGIPGRSSPMGTPNGAWACPDLIDTLARLFDWNGGQLHDAVREVLEPAVKLCPEVLIISTAHAGGEWMALHGNLFHYLLQSYVSASPENRIVLSRLWAVRRDAVVSVMAAMYSKDPTAVSSIVEAVQAIGQIGVFIEVAPAYIAMDIACTASRREYFDLEAWLTSKVQQGQLNFIRMIIRFLAEKLKPENLISRIRLTPTVQAIINRVLAKHSGMMQQQDEVALQRVHEIQQLQQQEQTLEPEPRQEQQWPEDINNEANDYFDQIFHGKLTIADATQMLQRFSQSLVARQQQVKDCMVQSLLDEFVHFDEYPDRERHVVTQLLGSMLRSSVLTGPDLSWCLEALLVFLATKPPGSAMFAFAIEAIRMAAPRLPSWPHFATGLASLPVLQQAAKDIHDAAVAASQPQQPQAAPQAAAQQSQPMQGTSAALDAVKSQHPASLSGAGSGSVQAPGTAPMPGVSTLEREYQMRLQRTQIPPEADQDRVSFNINNLSQENLPSKAADIGRIVGKNFQDWFSNLIVVKRAAAEHNFQPLYVRLVNEFKDPTIQRKVLSTTYHYVRTLLASEQVHTQASERSLLKNLGSWLGQLTLARNRPVLHKELSLKDCLFDAYQRGRMIAVVPFVHKVLEGAKHSLIFRPPNPWTMAILSLLVEIYTLGGDKLKLPIRFEVEMTLGDFNLKVADMMPSQSLHSYPRVMEDNPDWVSERKAGLPGIGPRQGAALPGAKGGPAASRQAAAVENAVARILRQACRINQHLSGVAEQLQLGKLVPVVLQKAVLNCYGLVERYTVVACSTAVDLLTKDFVFEPDEGKLRLASINMAQKLSVSLTTINMREPLKSSVTQFMHEALKPVLGEAAARDKIVQLVATDNLPICMSLLEHIALDRAVSEIDGRLEGQLAARAQARREGRPFASPGISPLVARLPPALRPRPLASVAHNVYDEFQPRAAVPSDGTADAATSGALEAAAIAGPGSQPGMSQGSAPSESAAPEAEAAPAPASQQMGPPASSQLAQRLQLWRQQLEAAVQKELGVGSTLRALPERSEVRQLVAGAPQFLQAGGGWREAALVVRQLLMACLSMEGNGSGPGPKLLTHAFAGAAGAIIAAAGAEAAQVQAPITEWVHALEELPRTPKEALVALVAGGGVPLSALDTSISRTISLGSKALTGVELAVLVISNCILGDTGATVTDFPQTIELLLRVAQRHPQGALLLKLVEQARARSAQAGPAAPGLGSLGQSPALAGGPGSQGPPGLASAPQAGQPAGQALAQAERQRQSAMLREQVTALFEQWIRASHGQRATGDHAQFVAQVRHMGLLNGDDTTDRFLRTLTEVAVQHCLKSEAPGSRQLSFLAVDSFVMLVVLLVKTHGGGAPLLAKVLSVVASVLQKDAAASLGAFNARPYFRMCVGLIYELTPSAPADTAAFGMLAAMAAALNALQPLRVPGFAFAWLELVSFRSFMPKLLQLPRNKGWPHLLRLLVGLLRFLEPYLHAAQLTPPIRLLYKGTLRVFLVLLHDFPEFLAEYHYHLCDAIPGPCIQLRNLVLSAFPRSMRLPDPLTPNLKVDTLPEMAQVPAIVPDPAQTLPRALREAIEGVVSQPARLPTAVKAVVGEVLRASRAEAAAGFGSSQTTSLVNALVITVGRQAIDHAAGTHQPPHMSFFLQVAVELEPEDRYILFNAIANHLRYPNAHTHYFSCVVLYIFLKAPRPVVKEQLTRVLLERLMVNRPHPWGLLVTFIELIKNPVYKFWDHEFTQTSEEIRRLFANVAQHMGSAPRPVPA